MEGNYCIFKDERFTIGIDTLIGLAQNVNKAYIDRTKFCLLAMGVEEFVSLFNKSLKDSKPVEECFVSEIPHISWFFEKMVELDHSMKHIRDSIRFQAEDFVARTVCGYTGDIHEDIFYQLYKPIDASCFIDMRKENSLPYKLFCELREKEAECFKAFVPMFNAAFESLREITDIFLSMYETDKIFLSGFKELANDKEYIERDVRDLMKKYHKKTELSIDDYKKYLFYLLDQYKDGNAGEKALLKAHTFEKNISITDDEISVYLYGRDEININSEFREMVKRIITINYLKEMVNQHTNESNDQKQSNPEELNNNIPSVLATKEANLLWEKARKTGYVDENNKPKLSKKKISILAAIMGEILELSPLWAPFESFWGVENLTRSFSQAKICNYYDGLSKEMKKALSE